MKIHVQAMSKDSETKGLLNDSFDASPSDHREAEKKLLTSRWTPACWYKDCLPCIKARYVLSFMIFLGLCNVYALRVNLSVAIVPMTSKNPPRNQRLVDHHTTVCACVAQQYTLSIQWIIQGDQPGEHL